MKWTQTLAVNDIKNQQPVIYRHGAKQVVVYKRDDTFYVYDNRCPHEGYPLREGTVDKDCVLTCNWHNWKFRLKDGKNLFGEDHLRVWPSKIENGFLMVDFSELPAQQIKEEQMTSLKSAFNDRRYDRIARILARLKFSGLDPKEAVAKAIHWSFDRYQYGMTHAFGTAPDWLDLYEENEDNEEWQLAFLAEAIDHMAHDSLREPSYPFTLSIATYSEEAFFQAVEAEKEDDAIALLNHALSKGLGFKDLADVLVKMALSHYRDFGHGLIYVLKAGRLIEHLGRDIEGPVLKALTRNLIYSSREDLIPEFRGYQPRLDQALQTPLIQIDNSAKLASPLGFSVNKAMDWVVASLQTHTPQQVYAVLLDTAAQNLMYFDPSYSERYDLPVSKNVGWLTITHGVTFANALRNLAMDRPDAWVPGLLQLACFTGRVAQYMDFKTVNNMLPANEIDDFLNHAAPGLLDHGYIHPIYACHRVKTWGAVREEVPLMAPQPASNLATGLNRFLNAKIKHKHVRRTIRQAVKLVSQDFE